MSRFILGQNYWYQPPDSIYPTIRESGVTMVRIGGHQPDLAVLLSDEQILKQVDNIQGIGAEPLIQVSRSTAIDAVARAAATVHYINVVHGRGVRYWSIGNEPDLRGPYGSPMSETDLAINVGNYTRAISYAMHDVDPTIHISALDMASYSSTKFNSLLGGDADITGKDDKGRYYVDGINFHRYPFASTMTRAGVLSEMHGGFEKAVGLVIRRIAYANALHGRVGPDALDWGLTEFNISYSNPPTTINNPAGLGVSSFLNGQFFAEYYRVGMRHGAARMNTWSMREGGGAGAAGDLGYLGGNWAAPIKRSSYYHMQMMADYLIPGGYLPATSTSFTLAVISTSTVAQSQLSVMLLNEDATGSQSFTIRMNDEAVIGTGTKINVPAGLAREYSGTIDNQTTVVLLFDTAGTLTNRITYSLDRYTENLAPLVEVMAPSFTQQPVSTSVVYGSPATFTVALGGMPAPTLQWRKGGVPIAGATTNTLTLAAVDFEDAGSYDCVATNANSAVASVAATLTVTPPPAPTIATQPAALTSRTGSGAFFAVHATGVALTYQWKKDGAIIGGATGSTLFLPSVTVDDAGNYTVEVTNSTSTVASTSAALTVSATGSARLVNLSARAQVGAGDNKLIPGFVITGGGSKSLLIRAIGPTLGAFGVTGTLPDPLVSVYANGVSQGSNDDWTQASDPAALEAARVQAGAFALVAGSKDSSLLAAIPATGANNTAVTSGIGDTTGVALVELFDLDAASSPARLVNISARAPVGVGSDLLVPGFVINGDVGLTLLIRGVGPTLGRFGVSGVLADPEMTLFRSLPDNQSEIVTSNDDWEDNANTALIVTTTTAVGGFPLDPGGADSVLLVTLKPGIYTVLVAGKGATTGVALVELYVVGQ